MWQNNERNVKYIDLVIEYRVCGMQKKWCEPSESHSQNTSVTYLESTISSNYSKQPYWILHTHFGKY